MCRLAIRARGILIVCAAIGVAVGSPAAGKGKLSRLQEVALSYVESYETVRRFDEYSAENRGSLVDVLTDDAYYERVFGSTAIDVHGALVAEPIADLDFPNVSFFRVYAATMNPPHPVYVLGVKANGSILRFDGFGASDFNLMVQGTATTDQASVDLIVRLYYRLHTPFRPGPILDDAALRRASHALTDEARATLFLPERQPMSASTALRICVFDQDSTRLEVHRLRVDRTGTLEVVERQVLRDRRKTSY